MPVCQSTEFLKELKHLKSSNKSKNIILISGLPDIRPDIRKPDIRSFDIQYPAGYLIAEKWPDSAGYRILNRISGPSPLKSNVQTRAWCAAMLVGELHLSFYKYLVLCQGEISTSCVFESV